MEVLLQPALPRFMRPEVSDHFQTFAQLFLVTLI